MTEGTRWQFTGFVVALVVLHFLLTVGLGLGVLAPDLLAVAVLLAARRQRGGQAAALGLTLGILEGAVHPYAMGEAALALAVVGYLASRSKEVLAGDSPVMLLVYLALGKWLYDLLVYLLLLRDHMAGPVSMLGWGILAALWTGLAGLGAVAAYRAVV